MKLLLITFLTLGMSFSSCAQQEASTTKETKQKETVKTITKRVSKTEFKQALKELNEIQLIDVRTPSEYTDGIISGAINIDFRDSDFETQIETLDKSKPTLIYCQGGGRSKVALELMNKLGFQHVLELEGGYSNW